MQDWSCQLSGRLLGKQLAFKFEPPSPLADLLTDDPETGQGNRPAGERDPEHEPGAFWNGKIWVSNLDLPATLKPDQHQNKQPPATVETSTLPQ